MFQQYFTNTDTSELLNQPGVLGVISFEQRCEAPSELGIVPVGLESLSGLKHEVVAYGEGVVERGVSHGCHWNTSADVMLVSHWVDESMCDDIENATAGAYAALYSVLAEKGYEKVFRIWNFIPNINSGSGDCEEYKKFCVGRAKAFAELGFADKEFPAASGLGHHSKGAVIYLLASRSGAPTHFENPRQQSAYHYPRVYGPRSPSFARATRVDLDGEAEVFVSGTASIIGYESKAPGKLSEQMTITVENINALVDHIDSAPQPLKAVRVYLRHASDFELAKTYLSEKYAEHDTNFLLADICSANLLVEIEAAFKGS